MIVDFHVHSTASDRTVAPRELEARRDRWVAALRAAIAV